MDDIRIHIDGIGVIYEAKLKTFHMDDVLDFKP